MNSTLYRAREWPTDDDNEFQEVEVEHDSFYGPGYTVVFRDQNGQSILAREPKKKDAERRAAHFRSELAAGHLLRVDPSVWR